jgi:hypothetical protein
LGYEDFEKEFIGKTLVRNHIQANTYSETAARQGEPVSCILAVLPVGVFNQVVAKTAVTDAQKACGTPVLCKVNSK